MLDLLGTVLTGGATGIIGSIIGKAFSFVDMWVEEKKADKEHERTIALLELQNKLGAEESERELALAESNAAADVRMASYGHDSSVGVSSTWVVDLLRLVRPVLTFTALVLVAVVYFELADMDLKETIIHSLIYMASSSFLWWFGDRTLRKKN